MNILRKIIYLSKRNSHNFFIICLLLSLFNSSAYSKEQLTTVRLGAIEGFSYMDNAASQRYKDSFESAIYYTIGENEKKLNQCGYKIETELEYFNSSDLLSINKQLIKLIEFDPWVIIGPTRSNQFGIVVKKIKNTPIISLEANDLKMTSIYSSTFLINSSAKQLALAALHVAQKEHLRKRYGIFLDPTCTECKDFSNAFKKLSTNHLHYNFTLLETGNSPNLKALFKAIQTNKIDFLLLPNYSQFSGYVMLNVHKKFPEIKFLGSDGWGQTVWGFIPAYKLPNSIVAYSIRSGTTDKKMEALYQVNSLNRKWNNEKVKPPRLSFYVIEFIRQLSVDLCELKPKNREEFVKFITQQKSNHFSTISDIGIYKLNDGQIQYQYSLNKKNNSNMLTIKNIEGVWKLKSFYLTKNGKTIKWGDNATGMLIYYPTGYMSVSINNKTDESNHKNPNAILKNILFYSGKYSIKDNIVLHDVENASDPNRINKIMIREAAIEGDSLKLIGKGDFGKAELTWTRISK